MSSPNIVMRFVRGKSADCGGSGDILCWVLRRFAGRSESLDSPLSIAPTLLWSIMWSGLSLSSSACKLHSGWRWTTAELIVQTLVRLGSQWSKSHFISLLYIPVIQLLHNVHWQLVVPGDSHIIVIGISLQELASTNPARGVITAHALPSHWRHLSFQYSLSC